MSVLYGPTEEVSERARPRTEISRESALCVGNVLRVNWEIVSVEELRRGMLVELEHGTVDPRTDVTDDGLQKTAKIALAHFAEGPQYYELLEKLERELERLNGGLKTDPFLSDT